ncbi:MAG: DUF885 domain-containing protein [bacterium]|nr:DUF885 domain-containing protein [bacterium]
MMVVLRPSFGRRFLKLVVGAVLLPVALRAGDDPSIRLNQLVEQYYEKSLELNPLVATYNGDHRFDDRLTIDIAPVHRARELDLERRFLAQVEAIDQAALDSADRLTLELFRYGRRQAIEALGFPDHLLPVDHLQSLPVVLAVLGGGSVQPFLTARDYDNWLARLDGWRPWVEQAIDNMRTGLEAGVVQPRIVIERVLPLVATQVVEDPRESVFYGPIERMPAAITGPERERLEAAYLAAIRDQVVPGYARLRDFLIAEYLPHCRDSVGLSDLPGGLDWYASRVRAETTTELTPEEVHSIGRREVARITTEIRRIQGRPWAATPGTGDTGSGRLLDGYRALRQRVEPRLGELFSTVPEADFEIRPVEAFRRRSAPGASYVAGTPDGSRRGRFYVNADAETRGAASEALFLHEAIPGHHFQISLQRELERLPRFRRFGHVTAYSEGWALYAESLGEDLGLYRTRDQKLRALRSELFRARRLVVDTGLHALGWSRKRAIDYLGSEREVDRYIAWPGQALAYKVGELRISELRARAEKRLGRRFDLRGFHEVVLGEGAMPLDILERRVEAWIEEQRE